MNGETNDNRVVYIVEDDVDVRETLIEVLEEEGYQPVGFSGGQEALAQLRTTTHRPAVILLDLMMPHMDGYQFRAEQQRNKELPPIPTVILSADSAVDQNMSALQADGYLRKPIQIKTLLQTVSHYCGAPQPLMDVSPHLP